MCVIAFIYIKEGYYIVSKELRSACLYIRDILNLVDADFIVDRKNCWGDLVIRMSDGSMHYINVKMYDPTNVNYIEGIEFNPSEIEALRQKINYEIYLVEMRKNECQRTWNLTAYFRKRLDEGENCVGFFDFKELRNVGQEVKNIPKQKKG
jgi:hypothetical protein